ncbi:MAG: hypothetical protein AAGJ74_06935 [Pseudomonadota bacterium]
MHDEEHGEDIDLSSSAEVAEAVASHFRRAMKNFEDYQARIEEGASVDPKTLAQVCRQLLAAEAVLIDTNNKALDELKRQKGVVHDYAIDLDAARAEVRRLLDCLQEPEPSGEVPGGS